MTKTSTEAGPPKVVRTPGRPRDPKRDDVILAATLELLAEDGFNDMSMEAVALRAGVGKPTIYRRWPSKTALVIDALSQHAPAIEIPEGATVREQLTALMVGLARSMRTGPAGRIMAGLVAQIHHDPELAEVFRDAFVAKRRRLVFVLLREGIERGELRPDLDLELAADQLAGPCVMRRLVTGGSLGDAVAAKLVDYLFDGWLAAPAGLIR